MKKLKTGDKVLTTGEFYGYNFLPCIVSNVSQYEVTAKEVRSKYTIGKESDFFGGHGSFYTIQEGKVRLKERESDGLLDGNTEKLKEAIAIIDSMPKEKTCCEKYETKFCPECGSKI
jgi:hypothetical protein